MNILQINIIDDAMDQDHNLTANECDFIVKLSEKSEEYELSENQNEMLNQISKKLD